MKDFWRGFEKRAVEVPIRASFSVGDKRLFVSHQTYKDFDDYLKKSNVIIGPGSSATKPPKQLSKEWTEHLLFEPDKGVVGYSHVSSIDGVPKDNKVLNMIHVIPEYQGKKYGRGFLAAVRALHGDTRLWLTANPRHNKNMNEEELRRFYSTEPGAHTLEKGGFFSHVLEKRSSL